jgi:hypothetical protein
MRRPALRWELAGIPVIAILGSVLHFVFEWSGQWEPVGVIAAVNESVWEHLKLAFWPALLYAVLEYPYLKRSVHNFMTAKAVGIYLMPAAIVAIFYSYTAVVGHEVLWVDILTFWVAVAIGQLISYRIMVARKLPDWLNKLGLALVFLLAVAFGVLTFHTPRLPIFEDGTTGAYGIPS